jgi:hypothetical protein
MKRFVKASGRSNVPPRRIITTSYRVVARAEQAAPGAEPEPLTPVNSFSELAARAYRQSRSDGADSRVNAVA